MEINCHHDPLGTIHSELNALWSRNPQVPDGVRIQMAIATAEVGANIIEHTPQDRPVRIRMDLELSDHQVLVDFTDDGPPIDIDLESVSMPDAVAEAGRGLAMARAVLGRFSHHRDAIGNHWTLISQRFA